MSADKGELTAIQQAFREKLDENELMNCMRCGFCLPACPTYIQTQNEAASPRGRIALMKAVYDGKAEPDADIRHQLDLCLGCRACEPVCPSGVQYGRLLEGARAAIVENKKQSLREKALRKLAFKELFPNPKRMRQATGLLRLYQKSGLKKLAEATGALKILPESLREMESILPDVPAKREMEERPTYLAPMATDGDVHLQGTNREAARPEVAAAAATPAADTTDDLAERRAVANTDHAVNSAPETDAAAGQTVGAVKAGLSDRDVTAGFPDSAAAEGLSKADPAEGANPGETKLPDSDDHERLSDAPSVTETANQPSWIAVTDPGSRMQEHFSAPKRVAFFAGCLMDTMFLETNNATLKLLQLAGCEVLIPSDQACCGALHGHSGELSGAKELAKRNIQAFEDLGVEAIITNAGGCGAFLMEYDHLLKEDPEWAARAQAFAEKIKDLSEVLIECGFHERFDLSLPHQVVTYQDSCHLRNVMKTSDAPRRLIQAIDGVEFRELQEAHVCCGSAGIYNLLQTEMATSLIDRKMAFVKAIAPQVIVTANPGCLLQMKLGIKRAGLEGQVHAVHIADFLWGSVPQRFKA